MTLVWHLNPHFQRPRHIFHLKYFFLINSVNINLISLQAENYRPNLRKLHAVDKLMDIYFV